MDADDNKIIIAGKIVGASERGSALRRVQRLIIQLEDSYWEHSRLKGVEIELVIPKRNFPFKLIEGEEFRKRNKINLNAFPYHFMLETTGNRESRCN